MYRLFDRDVILFLSFIDFMKILLLTPFLIKPEAFFLYPEI